MIGRFEEVEVLSDYCIWSVIRRSYFTSSGGYNTDVTAAAKAPYWRAAGRTPCLAISLTRLTQRGVLGPLHRKKLINLGSQQGQPIAHRPA